MSVENIITLCCSALTLVGVCITAWASIRKANMAMQQQLENLSQQVGKNREHDKEQYLAILRLTVMSEEMPVSERIIAGKRYIEEGGNGDVKSYYYEHLLPEHTK